MFPFPPARQYAPVHFLRRTSSSGPERRGPRMRPIMTASLIALIAVIAVAAAAARGGTVDRGYTAGKFALEIGAETRFVQSVEGGATRGVVADQSGDKRITGVVIDPIRAKLGSDDFKQLISD